jgi:hypothetical protein
VSYWRILFNSLRTSATVREVLPARTVTLTPETANTVQIRIDGKSQGRNAWHPGSETPDFDSIGDFLDCLGVAHSPGPQNPDRARVTLSVEERLPGAVDDLGWRPAGSAAFQVQQPQPDPSDPGPPPLWLGNVTLLASGKFRVVVREFEHYLDDQEDQVTCKTKRPSDALGNGPVTKNLTFRKGADRLVFAETIEL